MARMPGRARSSFPGKLEIPWKPVLAWEREARFHLREIRSTVRHLCQTSPSMCNSCLKFSQTYYERVRSIKKTYLSDPGEPHDFSNNKKQHCSGVVCVSYVSNRPIWRPGQHLALYFSALGIPGGCLGTYLGPIWCAGEHLGMYFL